MKMRAILLAALAAFVSLAAPPSRADDYPVNVANGQITLRSKLINGAYVPMFALTNPGTGLPYDASGGLPVSQQGTWTVGLVTGSTVGVTALPALPTGANAIGSVSVSNLPATQAISASALPLPTGASTAANQSTALTSLASISTTLTTGVIHLPVIGSGSVTGVSVGTSSALALAASSSRKFLAIDNESASAAIACAFGATAAINTAGSFTIPAGQTRTWAQAVPTEAVNCIAAATSAPVTIQAF